MYTDKIEEKNVSTVRALKIRELGENTGSFFKVRYLPETGALVPEGGFQNVASGFTVAEGLV